MSDTDPLNKSCDTILIVKEDQQNSIPKLDDRKMLIYIELTDEEKIITNIKKQKINQMKYLIKNIITLL